MPRYDENWFERINGYQPKHPPLPWSWLGKSGLIDRTLNEWQKLITTQGVPEREITGFLQRNAGLFFHYPYDYPFVLSEIRLGSEFVVDFALPQDRRSEGTRWHLIEMELPGTPPFKSNGDKSARLSHALDQIEQWKSWLKRRCRMLQNLFPCHRWLVDVSFEYHIVIGNRENSKKWLERRNELSAEYNVHIRSFDSFSERLSLFAPLSGDIGHWEAHDQGPFAPRMGNAIANPLYQAFGHAEWVETLRECVNCHRIMDLNADVILSKRSDSELLAEFQSYCLSRPRAYRQWLREFESKPVRSRRTPWK